jgi:spermidine synthase
MPFSSHDDGDFLRFFLSKPTDGWFREISEMWPGQAMTLKVNQVLHHEKSKYQDILIFESTDHGTVLVLDNVIQCTEKDEFSYVCWPILPL